MKTNRRSTIVQVLVRYKHRQENLRASRFSASDEYAIVKKKPSAHLFGYIEIYSVAIVGNGRVATKSNPFEANATWLGVEFLSCFLPKYGRTRFYPRSRIRLAPLTFRPAYRTNVSKREKTFMDPESCQLRPRIYKLRK